MFFQIYGFLKKVYKGYYHTHGQTSPALVLLACGTIASTIAHIAVYPLVLIRVRMQASDARALMIQTHEKNVITYLYDCYKELGVRKGLYRGLTPSLAKVVPAVSLSFLFYEKITQYIAASHETDEEKNLWVLPGLSEWELRRCESGFDWFFLAVACVVIVALFCTINVVASLCCRLALPCSLCWCREEQSCCFLIVIHNRGNEVC